MKKAITKIIMLALISLSHVTNAQSPNWLWAKGMGETGSDYGNSITTDAFGNVYTTGSFVNTVDFDPGAGVFDLNGGGGFISKLDNAGNFIWAKAIGGGGSSIAIDTGGSGAIYTTGVFQGTIDFDPGVGTFNLTSAGVMAIFISKLDSSGNFVWAKQFSNTNGVKAASQSIIIDASGSVYTTGHFQGTYDFDPGAGTFNLFSSQRGIFISKLDSAGNFVWAKRISGTFDAYGNSITLDTLGNIYTTGSFTETCDFDPGAGIFNLTSPGPTPINQTPPSDIFISKLDTAGNFVWAKQMGGTTSDYGMSITIDRGGSGAIYTTGFYSGTVDFDPDTNAGNVFNLTGTGNFISKLDSSGNFVWAKRQGGGAFMSLRTSGYSIVTDNFGNVYTTGTFVGTVDFDPGVDTFNLTSAGGLDIFISKLDSSGNFVWAQAAGGAGYDYGLSSALDASGSVHVAGYYRSPSIMFGSMTFYNAGATNTSDIFIAKLDATVITGTHEIKISDNRILLFPNPATNHLTIALENDSKKVEVTIADISGKIIYTTSVSDPDSYRDRKQKVEVNTEDFTEGVYVVQIKSVDFIGTKKLVVEK